jgi:HAD superfamily hydrolase (TIGR01549 family)
MIDLQRIRAITLDLDDTLWPVWPTIERAEQVLQDWLAQHAPRTAALCQERHLIREIRQQIQDSRPDLKHDLSAMRREAIRQALLRAGDPGEWAEPAFEVFFEARQRVTLFEDALPFLEHVSARFPVVALSNGNADVHRTGIGRYFKAAVSAREFGVGKPDPRIFHEAAARAGVPAAAVLHVGDDAHLDGVGALRAGMQCAWINRGEHVWEEALSQPLTLASLSDLCHHLQT